LKSRVSKLKDFSRTKKTKAIFSNFEISKISRAFQPIETISWATKLSQWPPLGHQPTTLGAKLRVDPSKKTTFFLVLVFLVSDP
jgi:hypothetical protein